MSDDTRRVLDLLAQGKITVDDAERLLAAMAQHAAEPAGAASPRSGDAPNGDVPKPRYVRIVVHKAAHEGRREKDVQIRVPIAIVKSGMRLGAMIPGFPGDELAARLRERKLDVDFSKLDDAAFDAMLKELSDRNIEVDSGKAQVRISCE
jgi:SHOCT-like protein